MENNGSSLIRLPVLGDADTIADVQVQGWRDAYAHLLPAEFYNAIARENRRRMWVALLRRAKLPDRLRVAQMGGKVVGVALADLPPEGEFVRELHLYLIYIRSQVYGTGVGQALLDAVVGNDPAELWVAKENPRAIGFYRRNGFAPDGAEQFDPDLNGLHVIRLIR